MHKTRLFGLMLLVFLWVLWTSISYGGSVAVTTIDCPGASMTQLTGINNSGQIAGYCDQAVGVLYSGGVFTPIIDPASPGYTRPMAIDDNGQIVGTANSGDSGFLYSGGIFSQLAYPGATDTEANGINDSGEIVGLYIVLPNEHGFLYSGGIFTTIDYPGAIWTQLWGVNNVGEVVGTYWSNGQHGFLYTGGTFTSIDYPGDSSIQPTGINDSGEIVGTYTLINGGGTTYSFSLSGGVYTTIDEPAGAVANGVNDSGDIVGYYSDQSSCCRGFLDTSTIPEPRPAFLMASGLVVLGVVRRGILRPARKV